MNLFVGLVHFYDVMFRVYMRLVAQFQPTVQSMTVFGASVSCARADFIQRRIAFFGLFEPNLTYFISHTVKPGDIFIDVGANIGYFTMLASKCAGGGGKVYAIEASPDTYRLLVDNLRRNRMANVEPINMAVADRDCHVRIHAPDSRNTGMSQVQVIEDAEAHSVVGKPLTAIVGPDLARASFIKVDVEGAEGTVLPGILHALASAESQAIVVAEINEPNAHLIDLAKDLGFSIKAIPNDYSIANLLARRLLRESREDGFFVLHDADSYISSRYDYVFLPAGRAIGHH